MLRRVLHTSKKDALLVCTRRCPSCPSVSSLPPSLLIGSLCYGEVQRRSYCSHHGPIIVNGSSGIPLSFKPFDGKEQRGVHFRTMNKFVREGGNGGKVEGGGVTSGQTAPGQSTTNLSTSTTGQATDNISTFSSPSSTDQLNSNNNDNSDNNNTNNSDYSNLKISYSKITDNQAYSFSTTVYNHETILRARRAAKAEKREESRMKSRDKRFRYYTDKITYAYLHHHTSEMFKYCRQMKLAGVKPDTYLINQIIDAFASTRRIDAAYVMFDQILKLKMTPTLKTLDYLLKACDVYSDKERARETVKKMLTYGIWPDIASHMYLISIYTKCNDFDAAWTEYEALIGLYGAVPIDVIKNFYRILLMKGNVDWLMQLFLEAVKHRIELPAADVYETIDIFLNARNMDGCKQVLNNYGHLLNEGTLSQILLVAARMGERELCLRVFNEVLRLTNNKPTKQSYTTLLYSTVLLRDIRSFLSIANVMAESGYKLGFKFADMFKKICNSPKELDEAREHLESEYAKGSTVTGNAISALLHACAITGELQRALDVFAQCNKYRIVPDIDIFNPIIDACGRAKDFNSAKNTMEQLNASGIHATTQTYQLLITHCVINYDLERATQYLAEMASLGIQPTYNIYANLAFLCAKRGDKIRANAILHSMTTAGLTPDDYLVLKVLQSLPEPGQAPLDDTQSTQEVIRLTQEDVQLSQENIQLAHGTIQFPVEAMQPPQDTIRFPLEAMQPPIETIQPQQ